MLDKKSQKFLGVEPFVTSREPGTRMSLSSFVTATLEQVLTDYDGECSIVAVVNGVNVKLSKVHYSIDLDVIEIEGCQLSLLQFASTMRSSGIIIEIIWYNR